MYQNITEQKKVKKIKTATCNTLYKDGRLCTHMERKRDRLTSIVQSNAHVRRDKTNTHISQDYLNFTLFEKEQKTAAQWFVVNLIYCFFDILGFLK